MYIEYKGRRTLCPICKKANWADMTKVKDKYKCEKCGETSPSADFQKAEIAYAKGYPYHFINMGDGRALAWVEMPEHRAYFISTKDFDFAKPQEIRSNIVPPLHLTVTDDYIYEFVDLKRMSRGLLDHLAAERGGNFTADNPKSELIEYILKLQGN